ncbi:MAG: class I SAM-dependent methyltransferase [Candidatus Nomurabacteria bacterium]|nr:class I SAM-dependent methyltransferase [Candidatus Nomurabacteria bacterium]
MKNLKAFDLRENMIVADLGAGSGFYAIPVAKMVPLGKVYAIEIQKDFLTAIKNKALEAHIGNIEYLLGDVEKIGGTKIKDKIVDAVIASNIFFQVGDKDKFIEEAKRILKPEGKLLLIDWSDSSSGIGSSFDKIIPKNIAREMFEKKGFIWQRDIDAGAHHYGIIFKI